MKKTNISFEFFPPKTRTMSLSLWQAIKKLEPLNPDFVSVTYGAGGTTRERTHKTIKKILNNTNLKPASHLTCVGASKDEIKKIATNYAKIGVKHIVALRGDLPQNYNHPQDGYKYAANLVTDLKKLNNFKISVAAYPEKHPEAKTLNEDIDYLKQKIDAGADQIITQFFFDNNKYYEFLNLLEKKQVKTKIIPGILPIINFPQTIKFATTCGTSIPKKLYKIFDDKFTDENSRQLLAAHTAIEQCQDLINNGVKDLHFYTLNRAELTLAICHILGIKKQ